MAIIGKFSYNGSTAKGKLIVMDIGSSTNMTRVDLDFGDDEDSFSKAADALGKMEAIVRQKLPSHPVVYLPVRGSRAKAIFLRGRSFNGDLLPERDMIRLENVEIVLSQIKQFDSNIEPENLEEYPTL